MCSFATNGCRTNASLCCYQDCCFVFFACLKQFMNKNGKKIKTTTKKKKARFVLFFFSFSFGPFLPCLLSFLIRVLSHLSPSANAHHPWVCGVQPIQPSGLQQLQAGRKPRRKQQGNGRIHAKQRNPDTANLNPRPASLASQAGSVFNQSICFQGEEKNPQLGRLSIAVDASINPFMFFMLLKIALSLPACFAELLV